MPSAADGERAERAAPRRPTRRRGRTRPGPAAVRGVCTRFMDGGSPTIGDGDAAEAAPASRFREWWWMRKWGDKNENRRRPPVSGRREFLHSRDEVQDAESRGRASQPTRQRPFTQRAVGDDDARPGQIAGHDRARARARSTCARADRRARCPRPRSRRPRGRPRPRPWRRPRPTRPPSPCPRRARRSARASGSTSRPSKAMCGSSATSEVADGLRSPSARCAKLAQPSPSSTPVIRSKSSAPKYSISTRPRSALPLTRTRVWSRWRSASATPWRCGS